MSEGHLVVGTIQPSSAVKDYGYQINFHRGMLGQIPSHHLVGTGSTTTGHHQRVTIVGRGLAGISSLDKGWNEDRVQVTIKR